MSHILIINPSHFLGDVTLAYMLMETLGMGANAKRPGPS